MITKLARATTLILKDLPPDGRGSALVLAAVGVLLGCASTGLAIDYGKIALDRRDVQNGVDAAALAGGYKLLQGGTVGESTAEGTTWLGKNGLSAASYSSAMHIPPAAGSKAGNSQCVEAASTHALDDFFTPGLSPKNVTARAVACIETKPGRYSIMVMNPTACSAFTITGNASITVNGSGTYVKSSCSANAFSGTGNITIDTDVNDIVGGHTTTGNVHITPDFTKAPIVADPLAGIGEPVGVTSPVRTCPSLNGNGSYTFQPGYYNCSLNPNGNWNLTFAAGNYNFTGGALFNGNLTVTLNAGIYTFGGTGFRVNGNANVTGNGAMFHIPTGGCFNMNGNGTFNIDAPSTGTYAGILLFQGRSNTCDINVNGNAAQGAWGTIYGIAAKANYNGNATTSYQFIVDKLAMTGNSNVTIDWSNNKEAQVPTLRLVE